MDHNSNFSTFLRLQKQRVSRSKGKSFASTVVLRLLPWLYLQGEQNTFFQVSQLHV